MSNSMTTTRTPHRDVRAVYDAIAAVTDSEYVFLEPGDPFYIESPSVIERRAEDLGTPDMDGWHGFVRLIAPDGSRVVGADRAAWFADHDEDLSSVSWWQLQPKPNAVVRVGDYLVISGGEYTVASVAETDGEVVYEMIDRAEALRRESQARTKYLEAHPEIKSAMPAWADSVSVEAMRPDEVAVQYSATFGEGKERVTLARTAFLGGESLTFDDDTTAPMIFLEVEGDADPDRLRAIARSLLAAADAIDGPEGVRGDDGTRRALSGSGR